MKIGEVEFKDQKIEIGLDGDYLFLLHNGKKTYFDESQLIERNHSQTFEKMKGIDTGSIGLEPGKFIRIPKSVLKTRDIVRENRANDPMRKLMKKIGEEIKPYGLLEYFMFGDELFLYFEKYNTIVPDKNLIKTEEGIAFLNEEIKELPESSILIPDVVIKARDEIREENEYKRRFRTLAEKDGFKFVLNEDKLIIQYDGKEAIAENIETIYGKSAVNIDSLNLSFPYLELPNVVLEEFGRVINNKVPEGLQLVPAGKSLLNGLQYYKLNKNISEYIFNKVKIYFEYFGESGDFSGHLTAYPDRVKEILKI